MIRASTAELKTHLGRYLRMVRNGETVDVTSHRHSVAKLVPYEDEGPSITEPVRSMKELKDLRGLRSGRRVKGLKLLLEDRARR